MSERAIFYTPDCNDYRCRGVGRCLFDRAECIEYLSSEPEPDSPSARFAALMTEHLSKFTDDEIEEMHGRAEAILRERGSHTLPLNSAAATTDADSGDAR